MSLPAWSPIARHGPVHDLPREDGGQAAVERRRREAGIEDRNALSSEEALAKVRAIRARVRPRPMLDSTALIRADRDSR